MSSLPDPQPGHRWVIENSGEGVRERRPVWPWIVTAIIVIALCLVAWFAGNWVAKDLVQRAIRDEVVETLELPRNQELTVEVEGFVIPQLIVGELDHVRIAGDDIVFGELSGDVRVAATGIPIRSEDAVGAISGEVVLTEPQLRAVLATADGFPVDTVSLAAPDVAVSIEVGALGVTVPVEVSLTPSAEDGDIVLSPAALVIGDAAITAEDLRARFGPVSGTVLRSWTVCIAQWMPSGVTLTDLDVVAQGTGSSVVAVFDVDGRIAQDESLQETGVCP